MHDPRGILDETARFVPSFERNRDGRTRHQVDYVERIAIGVGRKGVGTVARHDERPSADRRRSDGLRDQGVVDRSIAECAGVGRLTRLTRGEGDRVHPRLVLAEGGRVGPSATRTARATVWAASARQSGYTDGEQAAVSPALPHDKPAHHAAARPSASCLWPRPRSSVVSNEDSPRFSRQAENYGPTCPSSRMGLRRVARFPDSGARRDGGCLPVRLRGLVERMKERQVHEQLGEREHVPGGVLRARPPRVQAPPGVAAQRRSH